MGIISYVELALYPTLTLCMVLFRLGKVQTWLVLTYLDKADQMK